MPVPSLRSLRVAALAAALLAAPGLARAQDQRWRQDVDVLVDRWASDVGSSRVERALDAIALHLRRSPDDPEALLEKARLTLALEPDPELAPKLQADQAVTQASEAITAAERAVQLFAVERRPTALAIALLATQRLLHAELARLGAGSADDPRALALAKSRQRELEGRRRRLEEACGKQAALRALEQESDRLETLENLDRLGAYPRPIGATDRDGEAVDLTAYSGKVLLVLFWSSQVGDSAPLFEEVQRLYAELHPRGFEVIAVNCDDTRERFEAALAERGAPPWRHCWDGLGQEGSVARAWSVRAFPDGALVDHTGRVRYLRPWRWDLRLAVEELLARRDRS